MYERDFIMKKIISILLVALLLIAITIFGIRAYGNKKEEDRITNLVSDTMSEFQLSEFDVSIKNREIEAHGIEKLSDNQKLYLVKYLYFSKDMPIRYISDGTASYYYKPYNMSKNAPTPGLYEGGKLILADKNPFRSN